MTKITNYLGIFQILLCLIGLFLSSAIYVQAGFWTFYFPNFLKPSGYKEVNDMLELIENNLNSAKDNFADIEYFWGLMQNFTAQSTTELYPEESVCDEIFPMFIGLAIEYAYIDYDHYIKPMQEQIDHLTEVRTEWYPKGDKSGTILPRKWEQQLYEKELESTILWHKRLTEDPKYKDKRNRLVQIWNNVKRSLDTSLSCIYLRYAYQQIASDINQLALEMNLEKMEKSMNLLRAAYKRIEFYKSGDGKAIEAIAEAIRENDRLIVRD